MSLTPNLYREALEGPCPACGSPAGTACVSLINRKPVATPHEARRNAAKERRRA